MQHKFQSITQKPRTVESDILHTGRVIALSISHLIHDVYSSFLSPLLPLLIEKLSLSLTQAGFLSTIMQIPALLNPYIGKLADRINVRYFIIIAPTMTAVPMSLLGTAPSYGILLILLFITGVSVSIFHVPSPVIISRLSGSRKGRGMSFFMTGGELAGAVGPMVAVGAVSLLGLENFYPIMLFGLMARSAIVVVVGFIADLIGLRATYFLSAGIGLLGIPFIFMLPKK